MIQVRPGRAGTYPRQTLLEASASTKGQLSRRTVVSRGWAAGRAVSRRISVARRPACLRRPRRRPGATA